VGLGLEEGVRKKDAGEGVMGPECERGQVCGGGPGTWDWAQRYLTLEGAAPFCGFAPGPVDTRDEFCVPGLSRLSSPSSSFQILHSPSLTAERA